MFSFATTLYQISRNPYIVVKTMFEYFSAILSFLFKPPLFFLESYISSITTSRPVFRTFSFVSLTFLLYCHCVSSCRRLLASPRPGRALQSREVRSDWRDIPSWSNGASCYPTPLDRTATARPKDGVATRTRSDDWGVYSSICTFLLTTTENPGAGASHAPECCGPLCQDLQLLL
jgi:hypothetical protein